MRSHVRLSLHGTDVAGSISMLAATNRPDVLDPALLRPGRFDRQVMVELPDQQGREGILQIHTRPVHLGPDANLRILAQSTTGMSGSDLANLCNEAALIAARHHHLEVNWKRFSHRYSWLPIAGFAGRRWRPAADYWGAWSVVDSPGDHRGWPPGRNPGL